MNFKSAVISDPHIGSYQSKTEAGGLNGRLIDFIKTYNETIEFAISQKVELYLLPGDIFRNKTPTPYEIDAFTAGIKRLIDNEIQVVVVLGNHDTFDSHILKSSISFLTTIGVDRFIISDKPEILKIQLKSGPLQIQTMPYQRMSLLNMKSHEEVSDYMVKTIEEMYETRDKKIPIIFAGHFTIRDAKSGSEQKSVNTYAEPVVPKYVFENKDYLYIGMGHLHEHQIILEKPLAFYSGSTNRRDFNEDEGDKGFVYVEVEGKKVNYKFIKVNARNFVDLSYDLCNEEEPQKFLLNEINNKKGQIKDAVVRLQVTLSESNRSKYDVNEITKYLDNICNHISGSSVPTIRKTKQKVETHFSESMTSFQALTEYAKIHVKQKEDLGLFEKFGEDIIKAVNERSKL